MTSQTQATELGFVIEHKPAGLQGETLAWVRYDNGRTWLATAQEVALWEALQRAQARVVELEAAADAHEESQERKGRRR